MNMLASLERNSWSRTTGKTSMVCCTTKAFPTSRKSFEQGSSAGITTTHQQTILESRKHENLLPENTTGQCSAVTSKTTWRDAIYAWPWKQFNTSPMVTYNLCRCLFTARRIYWWILLLSYQFWRIGRETAMTQSSSSLTGSQKWFITSLSRSPLMPRALLRSSST